MGREQHFYFDIYYIPTCKLCAESERQPKKQSNVNQYSLQILLSEHKHTMYIDVRKDRCGGDEVELIRNGMISASFGYAN